MDEIEGQKDKSNRLEMICAPHLGPFAGKIAHGLDGKPRFTVGNLPIPVVEISQVPWPLAAESIVLSVAQEKGCQCKEENKRNEEETVAVLSE